MPQLNDFIFLLTGSRRDWLPEGADAAFLILLLCMGAFFVRARLAWLRPLENFLSRLARRETLCIALVGMTALFISAVISLCGRIPIPGVHDEFSYLLAADTFAHGRITNPTPTIWVPFETFHVIMQPTYTSKYPPGQSLMLALGQILTGHAFVGAWLGTVAACMAIGWMLYRWLPQRWAFLTALLSAAHPALIYWAQCLWGCQLVIVGSALALGGLRIFLDDQTNSPDTSTRIMSRQRNSCGWIIGIGMMLMILTRPYESGVLTLLILAVMAMAVVKKRRFRIQQIAPVGLFLILTVLAQGYYNLRVTGNFKTLPYLVHEKTYGVSPLFLWQHFKPEPVYRHRVLRVAHVLEEAPDYVRKPSALRWLAVLQDKLMRFLFLHCQLAACALALFWFPFLVRRDPWMRLVAAFILVMVCAILVEVWLLPQYTTPMIPLGFVLTGAALRRARAWRWHGRQSGLFLVRATILLSLLSLVSSYRGLADPLSEGIIYSSPGLRQFAAARDVILQKLNARPDKKLVIVRYDLHHNNAQEWVYNLSDMESQKVVWARAMTPAKDRALAEYYKARGHTIWILEADKKPPRLERFGTGF